MRSVRDRSLGFSSHFRSTCPSDRTDFPTSPIARSLSPEQAYAAQQGMWLTPAELFAPHYSNVLADFVADDAAAGRDGDGLEVVELGGGRATNAAALLDRLRDRHAAAYDGLRCYSLLDASPTLHALQGEVLRADGAAHADKVALVHVDMTDVAEGK